MPDRAVELQIAEFIDRYTPEIASSLRACRKEVRAMFPRGYEQVYDNYNALVFGFGPSDRAPDSMLSLAAYPRWINLFFLNGATLDDPAALLQGAGSQIRSIRLTGPEQLDSAAVRALIAQALAPVEARLAAAPRLQTVVKAVSAKPRPRRPG